MGKKDRRTITDETGSCHGTGNREPLATMNEKHEGDCQGTGARGSRSLKERPRIGSFAANEGNVPN
jgi:hypothetical protein